MLFNSIKLLNSFIENFFNKKKENVIYLIFFAIFIILYLFDFEHYNTTFATDYQVRYKTFGLDIVNQILNLDFSSNFLLFGQPNHYAFFNSYFVPELITGVLLYLTPNEQIFSIISNFLNMFLLFFSIKFFFNSLDTKYKNQVTFIFFIFFFAYIANWVWVFWKLAEIYFLFIFSLIFFFMSKGIKDKKFNCIVTSFFLICLLFITKPQALAVIPFFLSSIILLYYKKFNFLKFLIFIILSYLIFFPLFIFFVMKFNGTNMLTYFYLDGKINGIIYYNYEEFLNQFSLLKSDFTELFYYYFLILKKVIYQITFIRESYSIRHNIFLIPYTLAFYFFLIINLDYLIKNYNLFFKLTILIYIFTIMLHSSLGTSAEPNRTILFNLIPMYILASISFQRCLQIIYSYYFNCRKI